MTRLCESLAELLPPLDWRFRARARKVRTDFYVPTSRLVDLLNVGIGSLRTGVFNVADMAILFGAAVFIVSEMRKSRLTAASNTSP